MSFDFTIEVHNKFSAELQKAQQEIESVRQSFTTLKTEMQNMGSATKGLKDAAKEMRALGNQRNTRAFGRANVNLSALGTTMRRLGNQAQGLIDVATGINAIKAASRGANARGFNSLATGLAKLNAQIQALNIQAAVARLGHLTAAILNLRHAVEGSGAAFRGFATNLTTVNRAVVNAQVQAQNAANRIRGQGAAAQEAAGGVGLFNTSLGRLAKAYIAIRGFQTLVQGFRDLVTVGIEFNATLEQSELSLAALITQNFEVLDSQGRLVEGAEAFAEAQKIARQQVARLRVDALETTATFKELLLAVTAGFGAGGQGSGLTPDSAREISVLLSKAATTIQISGDQFAEEIRSALSGTAEQRTTRLALVTGIDPEEFNRQVRQARAQGRLFEYLEERFRSFAQLGDEAAKSFFGRLARLKEGIEAVVAAGAIPFFNALKSLFATIADQLVVIDQALQTLTPKPEAVQAFNGISEGMAEVAREAERVVNSLTAEDVTAIGTALAEGFKLAAKVIGPFLENFVRVLNQVARFVTGVFRTMRALVDLIGRENLTGALRPLLKLFGVIFDLQVKLLEKLVSLLIDVTSALSAAIELAGGLFEVLGLDADSAVESVDSVTQALKQLRKELLGVNDAPKLKVEEDVGSGRSRPLTDQERADIAARTEELSAQAVTTRRLNELRSQTLSLEGRILGGLQLANTARDLAVARARESVAAAQAELDLVLARNKAEEADLREKIRKTDSTSDALALGQQLTALRAKNAEEANKARLSIQETELQLARLNAEAERPLSLGFQVALQNLDLDPFTEVVSFIESAVQGLSAAISEALLAGFLDPTKDISEVFSDLFKSLSQQLLQLITQALIVRALSTVAGAFGAGPSFGFAAGGQVPGFAAGGPVPGGSHAEIPGISKLVKGIRGFASGGVAPSDTVPAMLTPGEWVIRLASVRKAGPGVMAAINEGRFDPQALAAAVGTSRSFRRHRGIGYASGGQVRPAGGSFSPAVLIANDQSAERLMAGGRRGVMSFLRANASEINAILGARRG